MNIRDLEYLVALSEFKHFRRAADSCNVSQPTLSGQIRKLEDELALFYLNVLAVKYFSRNLVCCLSIKLALYYAK